MRLKRMANFVLKSYVFRREREHTWQALASLVSAAEQNGITSLSTNDLLRLPVLYRATLSSLSVARNISLDRNVVQFLEALSGRAYFSVYGARGKVGAAIWEFFRHQFPAAVRTARWYILAATCFFGLGVATGFFITMENQEWFYGFVSADYAQGRTPASSTDELRSVLFDRGESESDRLGAFASFLFTNNASIGLISFALGFAFGVPTILLLFINGVTLGAFAALYADRGLALEFWGWLFIHGTTEIMGLILAGAAGLLVGGSIAFPGRHSRMDNLAHNGRRASQIAMGVVAMIFFAALLEGFGRQLINSTAARYLIGFTMLLLWIAYFLWVGRRQDHGRG